MKDEDTHMEQVNIMHKNEEFKYNNLINWFHRNISAWNNQRPST